MAPAEAARSAALDQAEADSAVAHPDTHLAFAPGLRTFAQAACRRRNAATPSPDLACDPGARGRGACSPPCANGLQTNGP
jgi:hypothetical protein